MGDLLSTLSQPNSSAAADDIVAVRSNSTKPNQAESTQQRQSPESAALIDETSGPPTDAKTAGIDGNLEESKTSAENRSEESVDGGDGGAEEEGEEEEAGECGFCLFMKGGGCKEAFIEWENCIEEAEKKEEDVVEKCYTVTSALKKCMEANSDYYAPILQAEKSMEEEAAKKLEEEKEKEGALVGNDSKKQS